MSLRLRFMLVFSAFVACLLIVFSVIVYGVNASARRADFREKLQALLQSYGDGTEQMKPADSTGFYKAVPALSNCRITLLGSNLNVLYHYPVTDTYLPSEKVLGSIGEQLHFWKEKGNEYLGVRFPGTGRILIAGAYDGPGFNRLMSMRFMLLIMVVAGTAIAVIGSWCLFNLLAVPLRRVSQQIKRISQQPVMEKLPTPANPDTITGAIAQSFNALMDRVERLAEFQKTFVYHASHEFRTPLATMLSQTEAALSKDLDPGEFKKILTSLKEEQQDLIELTSSLLLLSLSDSNDFTKGWTLLRIDEVLYDTVSKAGKFFPRLHVDMQFASIPDNPDDFLVRGEESLLRSAFLNILKNGHLYGIDQRVEVLIEFIDDTILVHFDNRGTQLLADEKSHIFEPFFRGSNALKTKGYGLGLSVVNRIVMVMKGRLQYTALGGDVNRFTITLRRGIA